MSERWFLYRLGELAKMRSRHSRNRCRLARTMEVRTKFSAFVVSYSLPIASHNTSFAIFLANGHGETLTMLKIFVLQWMQQVLRILRLLLLMAECQEVLTNYGRGCHLIQNLRMHLVQLGFTILAMTILAMLDEYSAHLESDCGHLKTGGVKQMREERFAGQSCSTSTFNYKLPARKTSVYSVFTLISNYQELAPYEYHCDHFMVNDLECLPSHRCFRGKQ